MLEILKYIGKELKTWRNFIFSMWGILSVVYGFIICHFIWGNHDWNFIKSGVKLNSGFFEERYSQHIFNVFLFDGNILPILTLLVSLLFMVIFGILLSYYFKLNQNRYAVFAIVLFVGLNPYLFGFFYYSHYILAISIWHVLVVVLLIFDSQMSLEKTVLFGGIGYAFLLGGYPPVLALSFTLFCARQFSDFLYRKNTWNESIYWSVVFVLPIIVGAVIHKVICLYLINIGVVNTNMANLAIKSISGMLSELLNSLVYGFTQFTEKYLYLENNLFLISGFILSLISWFISMKKQRIEIITWFLFTFIASRVIFIVAQSAYAVEFRIGYWGKLGIIIFVLVLLLNAPKKYLRNITYVWMVLTIVHFLQMDFLIQKNWKLGFEGYRKYQKRVAERIETHPDFDSSRKYISTSYGNICFNRQYYHGSLNPNSSVFELSHEQSFDFEVVQNMFWENQNVPLYINFDCERDVFVKYDLKLKFLRDLKEISPAKMLKLQQKYCPNLKSYPSQNFLCTKDNYLWTDFGRN